MASISLPTMAIIATTAAVGSGAMAAVSSRQQGIAVQRQDRAKADAAALQAGQQQINQRQRMMAALASQDAGTIGAVGTGVGSSFGANAMRQINQGQNDLMVTQANESSQVSLLNAAGANAAASGSIGAAGDALGVAKNTLLGNNAPTYIRAE